MSPLAGKAAHPPWEDRFRVPTDTDLIAPLARAVRSHFTHVRRQLQAIPRIREQVKWCGIPWRWTFSYWPVETASPGGFALAYLIPDPQQPMACLPVDRHAETRLITPATPRVVREALGAAVAIGSRRWIHCPIVSDEQVHAILWSIRALCEE